MKYDVTALGELLIDFAPVSMDANGYPTLAANAGGAPPNFLAALSKYGAKTAMMCKVGNDAFGKMLTQTLKDIGVDTSGVIVDDSVFTTLAFVTIDDTGDRSFSFARKPGADTCIRFDELDLSLIDNSRVFHHGTLSLTHEPAKEATQKAVAYAKNAGKMITFDPNLRESLWDDLEDAKTQILWGLSNADIVKISDEEVKFLWDCNEQEGAEKLLNEYSVKLAMVTSGAGGVLLKNKKASAIAACPKVKPVDTTGAGDIFGGSALCYILKLNKAPEDLEEDELSDIATFAVTAASLSTQKWGGVPSVPDEEEFKTISLSEHAKDIFNKFTNLSLKHNIADKLIPGI